MNQLFCFIDKTVEEPVQIDETMYSDEKIYIDLMFTWDDGGLCCSGCWNWHHLHATGSSMTTLQLEYKNTFSENDENDNYTDTLVVDDIYNLSDMNKVTEFITNIKDSYICGEEYKKKIFNFFDSIYELKRNPENWNIIMAQYRNS
jgi:hypothetical protein